MTKPTTEEKRWILAVYSRNSSFAKIRWINSFHTYKHLHEAASVLKNLPGDFVLTAIEQIPVEDIENFF